MAQPTVRQVYRELFRYATHSNSNKPTASVVDELRSKFRAPLETNDSLDDRLKKAESRLSFLRMSTPKRRSRGESGKWIYKDGERLEAVDGTLRDGAGRVVSNWSGNNLDPQSVSTHRKQLKRVGFQNNLHAKGFF
jgi:hypothetical protein